jgi:hypothetical protein
MGAKASEKLSASPKKNDKLFYEGKLGVMKYYFSHELPKTGYLSSTIKNKEHVILNTSIENFTM